MKKKALLTSMLVIALCLCLIAGSTYALFTSEGVVNVAVTAGKVKVVAGIDPALKTWSLGETEADDRGGSFANGGLAEIDQNSGMLVIYRMTPGDTVKLTINSTNTSNISTKYRLKAISEASDETLPDGKTPPDLSEVLSITTVVVDTDDSTADLTYTMSYSDTEDKRSFETAWFEAPATDGENGVELLTITVIITFPNGTPEHDNPYQNGKAKIAFTLEAVQGNGVDENGNLITTP